MYDELFNILYREYNDSHKAYEHLLQFLAVDNCPPIMLEIEGNLEWFFSNKELADKIIKAYNLPLIKEGGSEKYDCLGDLYVENVIGANEASRKGLYLTPQPVVELMCQSVLGDNTKEEPNILEPCVGTGRFLLTASKYAPNARLYGVDNNLNMIKTAFTNAAIYNVSMYLLHADSLLHETDISKQEGRDNWQYANRWQSSYDKLKEMTPHRKEEVEQKYGQLSLF